MRPPEGLNNLGTAFRTLSIISWPGKEGKELSSSLPYFPVVGLFLGLILYGLAEVWALFPMAPWPWAMALLMVTLEVWLTRGLHLDGLADWADSLGGYFERERRLEIMKDSSVGAFGVIALVLDLTAKVIFFERLLAIDSIIWIPPVFAITKCMQVELITTMKSARAGNGMAGGFIKGASNRHRATAHVLTFIITLSFAGPAGPGIYALAWIMTRLWKTRCENLFGGITGDLLGTANEMIMLLLLLIIGTIAL
ncbi:MAG: adenosylcobinamide-GDP ribazoletransferase [Deltaproteobacteria bacterium]|nr:adenosylcobinamide-GDP ribazoletransferase [Deltaproteobacteria bacterium]